eukprot:3278374-Lingulodinium_polyedra.AAC.1
MINKVPTESEHWTLEHKSDAHTLERTHARAHASNASERARKRTQSNARAGARTTQAADNSQTQP